MTEGSARRGLEALALLVTLSGAVACTSARRDEPPPAAGGVPAAAPTDAGVTPGAGSMMDEHFLFRGEPSDRARALARVRRALQQQAAAPRSMAMPHITSLEDHLRDHVVEVTPAADVLRVLTYPAADATWELTFDVTPDDRVANMVVGQLAPPPGGPP